MSRSSVTLSLSPYVYLRLGEASGTAAVDSSGNSRNFVYNGSGITLGRPSSLTGDSNTAARFQSSYARSPFLLNASSVSMAVRVRFNGSVPTGSQFLIAGFADGVNGAASDKLLYLTTTGKWGWYVYDGLERAMTSSNGPVADTWYDIVGTVGATGLRLYVNGALDTSVVGVTSSYTGYTVNNVFIGGQAGASGWVYVSDMDLDEFALWNSQISAANVTSLYNAAITSPTTVRLIDGGLTNRSLVNTGGLVLG